MFPLFKRKKHMIDKALEVLSESIQEYLIRLPDLTDEKLSKQFFADNDLSFHKL